MNLLLAVDSSRYETRCSQTLRLWQRWLSLVILPPGRVFFLCTLRGSLRAGTQTDAQTEKPQAVQRSEVEIIDTCWLGCFTAQTQQSGALTHRDARTDVQLGQTARYAFRKYVFHNKERKYEVFVGAFTPSTLSPWHKYISFLIVSVACAGPE